MNDVQKVIYNIFLDISGVLKEHNIDYYANGGTCLGAVRHKGFIPWDDDIDIAVPIEQFVKRKIWKNPESRDTKVFHATDYIKKYPEAFKGVFVDVMPLSGMPDNAIRRHLFCRMINVLRILNDIRRSDIDEMDLEWKRKLYPLIRRFDSHIPISYFAHKWYEMLKRYPFKDCNYTGYVWWFDVLRLVYKKEVFGQPTPYPFEDTIIYCPQDADALLKQQFGDYMKLPPAEKRIPLHRGTLDLEHSYHDYQEGKYPLSYDFKN